MNNRKQHYYWDIKHHDYSVTEMLSGIGSEKRYFYFDIFFISFLSYLVGKKVNSTNPSITRMFNIQHSYFVSAKVQGGDTPIIFPRNRNTTLQLWIREDI